MDETQGRIHDQTSETILTVVKGIVSREGAHRVTVRKICAELGVTNRVFYNRFANVDEVLRMVYREAFYSLRACMQPNYHDAASFWQFCVDAARDALLRTFDIKQQFSRYIFEHDSLSEQNRLWWSAEITKHYRYALDHGFAREVDPEDFCYTVWCLYRGFFADADRRALSKEEAARSFEFGFRCLLRGIGADLP